VVHPRTFLTNATSLSRTSSCRTFTLAQPAGTLSTHEGVLYNPLAFALAKDALTHNRPDNLSRIDVVSELQKVVADGLGLPDLLASEKDTQA
jgi:hypothetical protein